MAFLPKSVADQVQGGGSGNYLNPSKLASGSRLHCETEPLCFFEAGVKANRWQAQALPFLEEPIADDVAAEMGNEFTRRQNRDGTGLNLRSSELRWRVL